MMLSCLNIYRAFITLAFSVTSPEFGPTNLSDRSRMEGASRGLLTSGWLTGRTGRWEAVSLPVCCVCTFARGRR